MLHTYVGTTISLLENLRREMLSRSPHSDGRIGSTIFDTLAVPAFFEFLFPIRYAIFLLTSGIFVPFSDMWLFHDLREKDRASIVNPVALTVLIATDDYVGKKVLNPGLRTWVKGRDTLLAWLKDNGHNMYPLDKNTAV